MSQWDNGDGDGGGATARKAPLTGVDRLFGRDLRRGGWVVEVPSDFDTDSADAAAGAFGNEAPLPAMMWALRARRK